VNLAGSKWLAKAGFMVGTGVILKVQDGCLMLLPDRREEIRLRQEQIRLEQQRREIDRVYTVAGAGTPEPSHLLKIKLEGSQDRFRILSLIRRHFQHT